MSHRGSQPRRTGRWPRRGAGDTLLLLWRAKWLMLAVFLPAFLAGAAAVMSVPQPVEARTRLMVSGTGPGNLQLEMELYSAATVLDRTASRFAVDRLYPGLAQQCRSELGRTSDADDRQLLEQACREEAARRLARDLTVEPSTRSSFSAWYAHPDPDTAVEVLNALTGAYLDLRAAPMPSAVNPVREKRRELEAARQRLRDLLAALAAKAGSADPQAEIRNTNELLTAARAELLRNRSRAVQVNSEVADYRRRLAGLEPEQFAFIEDTSARTLMQLQAEREEAATHGADAPRVIELDRQIAQARAYLQSRGGMVGTARREPNPVYQQTEIALARAETQAAALEQQYRDLQRRISRLEDRAATLSRILPEFLDLMQETRAMDQALAELAGEEARVDATAESERHDRVEVTILQPAEIVASEHGGRALRLLVGAGLAALLALLAGLLKVQLTSGFATPGMLERTLRLPVLAVVRRFR